MTDDVFERRTRSAFSRQPSRSSTTSARTWSLGRASALWSTTGTSPRLHAAALLTTEQAELWRRMIGFRNAVVHDSLDVDRAIVFDVVRNHLDDLRGLLAAIVEARTRR